MQVGQTKQRGYALVNRQPPVIHEPREDRDGCVTSFGIARGRCSHPSMHDWPSFNHDSRHLSANVMFVVVVMMVVVVVVCECV